MKKPVIQNRPHLYTAVLAMALTAALGGCASNPVRENTMSTSELRTSEIKQEGQSTRQEVEKNITAVEGQ